MAKRTNDIDHVMPRVLLEKEQKDPQMINSIANFQLLDFGTNRGAKNDSPLREWINSCVPNKAVYLQEHLIPTDEALWNESDFELFYAARAKLICERINFYFA